MNNPRLCINLHHVRIAVADVDEAMHRYEILLGLHGERMGNGAIMRCAHEDFCVAFTPADGRLPGVDYVAYELVPGMSLAEARRILIERGESPEDIAVPVRGHGLLLRDPDGNHVVLVERRLPADVRPAVMIPTTTLRGYHPRRLGHVNYLTADVKRVFAWYTNVLGFRLTDWIGDAAVWLHIDSRHHVLAFLEKGYNHIHHIAFELVDWGEMRIALDHICKHGRYITWGPLRHGMAQNLASYWRMWEEEHFIELYCDMQVLDEDHQPQVYPDNAYSSNTWGVLPPRSYFRFDPASVEKERASAHSFVEV
ncbi:MAG: VOC family protein [Thermoflexales bacterium]|nr:VOC family protein [Thermoflexales bacterium]MDW8351897.1 VOC family protein [Anaerolineae bacterium]